MIRVAIASLLLGIPASASAGPALKPADAAWARVNSTVHFLARKNDPLGVRVYLKKVIAGRKEVPLSTWTAVREQLHRDPRPGFDLIYIWDRLLPRGSVGPIEAVIEVETRLMLASKLMLAGNPGEAIPALESVAKFLRPRIVQRDGRQHRLHYQTVLHHLGRAYYAAGDYASALQVYEWIGPDYPRFRRVLFERMWAGFMDNNVERTIGVIADQRSALFSRFLEPEAYLIAIYMLKRLCREEELELMMADLKFFAELLRTNRFPLTEWLSWDVESVVLRNLLQGRYDEQLRFVSAAERKSEKDRIRSETEKRFVSERARLLEQLNSVIAYSQIAKIAGANELKPVARLPDRDAWLAKGLEIWPASDRESWIDELDRHRFLGESRCAEKRR